MPQSNSSNADATPRELFDTLARLRGTARMRLHLLSLEAKTRLEQLETRIDALQSRLEGGAEHAAASGVREVVEAVRTLLETHPGASLQAKAGELMRPVEACAPSDPLSRAAQLMWELDCGFVPVCDRGGNIVGVITDRDICMAGHTRGQLLGDIQVWSTMSTQVVTAGPSATLKDLLRLMRVKQVRRVPIVEAEKLIGAVTLADIALYLDVQDGASVGAVELGATLAAISAPRSTRAPGPGE